MTEVDVVKFKMGEVVPEWLIVVEPNPVGGPSNRGTVRFTCDVCCIEQENYYLVWKEEIANAASLMHFQDTHNCIIFAATKPVRFVMVENPWHTKEVNAFQKMIGSDMGGTG